MFTTHPLTTILSLGMSQPSARSLSPQRWTFFQLNVERLGDHALVPALDQQRPPQLTPVHLDRHLPGVARPGTRAPSI